ncbi:helix-turn-helix transcriptional regulator [Streptomyces melanosporofaciens]|uniref:LuxR family transcriptional regulator, maltose regulon positive regulatory protein n=1 Tax=Streptomyces melanosporofaciens TaxID=67327 RepID=A0A1H5ARW7_STRMJ|nr:LuxR C-terminal-related transcriptional regulator [Streptomyces melanosporofaciens]SED45002.1 LuxR family transcriptional regulator, maltose regulon positive regulatory protein [Streptomyces melanosporofaciens]
MTNSVPAFKLHPPVQPPHLLTRPRLLRRLDAMTEPVVVVSAPAGAGKTVLLTEWSRCPAARGECAWLGLDGYDNAPGRLWAGILRALRDVRPELPVHLDSDEWTLDAWLEEILPSLVAGLGGEGPLTLILDGLEAITDADAVRSLADFLTRLPQGLRVVLSTRHVPGRPVPTLRARGLIAELDQHDLAFTPGEAQEVLTGLLGSAPAVHIAGALYEATEGWAAGLCIMGRTLARSADPADAEGNVAHGRQAVAEYLATEVLFRLTTEQRQFLLRTSVLDELSTGACQALAGDRAGVLLRELARTVQLLVPVAADPSAYRHHRALAPLLADALTSEGPDTVVSLHRSAARWYARQGETTKAVRHWVLGGDESAAGTSILDAWEKTISAGRSARVSQWLGLLPPRTVAADARLCVVAAMAALSGGAPETARRWLDVAQLRATGPETIGEGSTVSDATAVARAVACCLKGEVLTADRLGESAVAGAMPLTSWRALGCTARGAALLWTARYEEAEVVLGEATRDAHAAGHGLALVRALGLRALCALMAGRQEPARILSDEALEAAATAGLSRHFVAVPAHICRAGLLLEEGRIEEAERVLADAEAAPAGSPRTGGEPHVRALYHVMWARLENARQDADASREAREAAERAADRCESPGVLTDLLRRVGGEAVVPPAVPGPQDLSLGERRVLRALCGPLTLREIASELYVSHNTVKTQVRAIFRKLDAHDRSGAIARARECGVL